MKKHGHYCKVCGEYKANEKFSGKGHAAYICKSCASLSPEKQAEQMTVNRLLNLPWRLSKEQIRCSICINQIIFFFIVLFNGKSCWAAPVVQVHILFIIYFAMIQIMAKKSSIVPCKDLMFIFVRILFLTPVKEEAIIIFQQVCEINFCTYSLTARIETPLETFQNRVQHTLLNTFYPP